MKTIDVKEVAVIIRGVLKQAFPQTKFSVKLDRYSMGHSIDVCWLDGPTGDQVKPILDRFESHGFDGMTDCSYYCGDRKWKGEQVYMDGGYVKGSRRMSAALLGAVADRVGYECGLEPPKITASQYGAYLNDQSRNDRVPYQWHSHWIDSGKDCADRRKYITMADITATSGHLLAHDSHEGGGEWLTTLIDRIAQHVSMEEQQPVELPEYIEVTATVETGRASWEPKQRMFEGHDALETEARAIAEFEGEK